MSENSHQQSTPTRQLARRNIGAMLGTLLSRFAGVLRVIVINSIFGATTILDAFNAAFRFPNSLRDLFADGALSAAFMKVLVDVEPQGNTEVKKLISIVSGFFLFVTLLLALLANIFAEPFMALVTGQTFQEHGGLGLAATLFQILVFYLPITMLNSVAMGVLGMQGKTFRAMNSSLWVSVGMIIGALLLAPLWEHYHISGIYGLATGAMLGVLLQLLYQVYPLWQTQLLTRPNFNFRTWWQYKPLHTVLVLMVPRALGQGAMVIALAINTFFATQIGVGALTYIVTAVLIIQVPIGLFGVATGFAALPVLTQSVRDKKGAHFSELLKESLRTSSWLATFTAVCFAVLLVPVYIIIFQHGKITFDDTLLNCMTVCAYAMGIIFAVLDKILINALYAVNATRQIVYNAFVYLVVNAVFSMWLAPKIGLVGLGISFSIATAVDCGLNYFAVARGFRNLQLGRSPYTKSFSVIITISASSGFLIGLLGIYLTKQVWSNNQLITHAPSIMTAAIILFVASIPILLGFALLVRRFGPRTLQQWLTKATG